MEIYELGYITFSVVQDMLNLVVSSFYPVTVENFEKLTLEIFIFYNTRLRLGWQFYMRSGAFFTFAP